MKKIFKTLAVILLAMQVCEGSEKERYANIYCGLVRGKNKISDEQV